MEDSHNYSYLMLAAQRGMLGEVGPSLRAVAVDWINNDIVVYFYNDGEITEELHDDFISITTDITTHFNNAMVDEKIIRLDYPKPLPFHEHWVYRRKEA